MKMSFDEAIEFCEEEKKLDIQGLGSGSNIGRVKQEDIDEVKNHWNQLIDLFKQGKENKVYKMMWEKFKFNRGDRSAFVVCKPCKGTIKDDMESLEHKYLKEKPEKTRGKGLEIHKTLPEDAGEFTPRKYYSEQYNTNKPLVVGEIYRIETSEPGEELNFKGRFLGWRIDEYYLENPHEEKEYNAIFEAEGLIEVEHDYGSIIMKEGKD